MNESSMNKDVSKIGLHVITDRLKERGAKWVEVKDLHCDEWLERILIRVDKYSDGTSEFICVEKTSVNSFLSENICGFQEQAWVRMREIEGN